MSASRLGQEPPDLQRVGFCSEGSQRIALPRAALVPFPGGLTPGSGWCRVALCALVRPCENPLAGTLLLPLREDASELISHRQTRNGHVLLAGSLFISLRTGEPVPKVIGSFCDGSDERPPLHRRGRLHSLVSVAVVTDPPPLRSLEKRHQSGGYAIRVEINKPNPAPSARPGGRAVRATT